MTARDLPGLSRQVLYDFEMLEALAKRLIDIDLVAPQPAWRERFGTTPADLERAWWEVNAMLESFLIHARNLVAFLYGSPPSDRRTAAAAKRGKARRAADAFAVEYFDDPNEWRRKRRGKRPAVLTDDDLTNRVSSEVAHVTYHRADFRHGGPPWNPYPIYDALAAVMQRFGKAVQPERVCEDFNERLTAALPARQPKREPPPRPGTYGALPVATQGYRHG
jgi:hypothetical protein